MTEQNKHTPGPWQARAGAVFSGSEGSPCFIARTAHPSREIDLCIRSVEERWHNARLIAAAPALSGAARSAASSIRDYLSGEWDGSPEGWEAVLRRLDAAIAQAEGVIAADPGAQIRAEMDRALEQLRERVGAEKVAALEDALGEGERRSSPEYYRAQEGER